MAAPSRARLWAPWAVGVASAVCAGVEERAVGGVCQVYVRPRSDFLLHRREVKTPKWSKAGSC
jgi:hypothetical protein